MDIADIIQAITNGDADSDMATVSAALRARGKYLSQQKAMVNKATLAPGTRVTIRGNIRPKYLLDLTGTVSEDGHKAGFIMVDIDAGQYTGRYGKHLNIPASCLARAS